MTRAVLIVRQAHNCQCLGTVPVIVNDKGGIDLSQIELTLQDEKFVSSLNPADLKILLAAKALKKDNWDSLSVTV